MSDDNATAAAGGNPPAWYWVAAIGALLFECLGCFFYLAEVRLTPEQIAMLPLDQAAMLSARPGWYYAAFGIAVWVGLVGTHRTVAAQGLGGAAAAHFADRRDRPVQRNCHRPRNARW